VTAAMGRDRNLFVQRHTALLTELLSLADEVQGLTAELDREKNKVVTQEEVVKVRRQEVAKLEEKLAERQKATRALLAEQTRMEKELFEAQKAFRDATNDNHKLEIDIRKLEKGR